jgi:hypothetical protein
MMKFNDFLPSTFDLRHSIFCGSLLNIYEDKQYRQATENPNWN